MSKATWRRMLCRMFATALGLVAVVAAVPQPAEAADTGGYPYDAQPGCAENRCTADPWRFYYRECTSFVAWKLNQNGVAFKNDYDGNGSLDFGSASNWRAAAERFGIPVNNTPAVGAVAWWSFGHVAWVSAVSGDTVTIEEYNQKYNGRYTTRPVSKGSVSAYIHFKNSGSAGGNTNPGVSSNQFTSQNPFVGTIPDAAVVENFDNGRHLYVAAGGALFVIEREYVWEYLAKARLRYGPGRVGYDILPMRNSDVHAVEVHYPHARAHPPKNGTFFYGRGAQQQYVMQFGYAFPVGSAQEVDALGGRDKAVMVPQSGIGGLLGVPSIPHNLMPQAVGDPTVYHSVNGGLHWVNNQTVLECVRMTKGGRIQPVTQSVISKLREAGRVSGGITTCQFPSDTAYYAAGQPGRWKIEGVNPYTKHALDSPLALRCNLGAAPREIQVPLAVLDQAVTAASISCVDGSFVRTPNGFVHLMEAGKLRPVPSPEILNCVMGPGDRVIDVDYAVIQGVPKGTPVSCDFEGKMLRRPDGRVAQLKGGKLYWIGNSFILNCVKVRASSGDPIAVTDQFYARYSEAGDAYCPYPADFKFVRGDGQATVWRIYPDGTRQMSSAYCHDADPQNAADPRYKVHLVPADEISGHRVRTPSVFYATVEACRAIT